MPTSKIIGVIRHTATSEAFQDLTVELTQTQSGNNVQPINTITDEYGQFELQLDACPTRGSIKISDGSGNIVYSSPRELIFNHPQNFLSVKLPAKPRDRKASGSLNIGGLAVSEEAFKNIKEQDLMCLVLAHRGKQLKPDLEEKIRKVSPHLLPDNELVTSCGNTAMEFIIDALKVKKAPEIRFQQIKDMLKIGSVDHLDMDTDLDGGYSDGIDSTCVVEVYETDHFRISFTQSDCDDKVTDIYPADPHVILHNDEATVIGTITGSASHPYIERLGIWLEYAYEKFTTPPFSMRAPGPTVDSDKVEVTVERLGSRGRASTSTFELWINNSLTNYIQDKAMAGTTPHEVFHLIQYQYTTSHGHSFSDFRGFAFEGTARAVEDNINDNINHYVAEVITTSLPWFNIPGQPLFFMTYDAAFFWKYFMEQYAEITRSTVEPDIGASAMRYFWETAGRIGFANMLTLKELDEVDIFSSFTYLLPSRNTELFSSETIFGNWLAANYLKDLGDPMPDPRFDYKEDEEGTAHESVVDGSTLPSVTLEDALTITPTSSYSLGPRSVEDYGGSYHEFTIEEGCDTIWLELYKNFEDDASPIVQIAVIGTDDTLKDLIRFDKDMEKTINADGVKKVTVIVGGTASPVFYQLNVEEREEIPDMMITRWDSDEGREYENTHLLRQGRTFHSPDIFVSNGETLEIEHEVFRDWESHPTGGANHLWVRVRNKGSVRANDVSFEYLCQGFNGKVTELRDDAWVPCFRNSARETIALSGLRFDPGLGWMTSVDWYIPPEVRASHICVKVVTSSPEDINEDNKVGMAVFTLS